MIESIILVMSIVSTDGRELVAVRMPYESQKACVAAAESARWISRQGMGCTHKPSASQVVRKEHEMMNGVWELGRRLRQWQDEYRGTAWTIGAVAVIGVVVLLILI